MSESVENKLQNAWDTFLIQTWFVNKGANMRLVTQSFMLDQNLSEEPQLERMPQLDEHFDCNLDLFAFIARSYPQVSNYLIETKPSNHERISKIINLFSKLKSSKKVTDYMSDANYLGKARRSAKRDTMKAASRTVGRGIYCAMTSQLNGSDWRTCS